MKKISLLIAALFSFFVLFIFAACDLEAEPELITITFTEGGSEIGFVSGEAGTDIPPIDNPVKEGYKFAGWYSDAEFTESFTLETFPLTNTSLYAKWLTEYTITFEVYEGSAVSPINQGEGMEVEAPAAPVKAGYIFMGWYSDSGLTAQYVFSVMPPSDITLYANWAPAFIISFITNSPNSLEDLSLPAGAAITAPVPTKRGYEFAGWYSDLALTNYYHFTTMPEENFELYADWGTAGLTYDYWQETYTVHIGTALNIENVIIPKMHSGYPIIAMSLFCNANMQSIQIPNTVTFINEQTFMNCDNLVSIAIPSSVTSIGRLAFSGFEGEIIWQNCQIPEMFCLAYYEGTSLTIPEGVTSLNDVNYCSNLISVNLPESLEIIGDNAFKNDRKLDSLIIPAGVKSIGTEAFYNLTCDIDFAEGSILELLGSRSFSYYEGEHIILPDSIIGIGSHVFSNCINLLSIQLPSNLISIGGRAFADCDKLSLLNIPASVDYIEAAAFYNVCGNIVFENGSVLPEIFDKVFEGYLGDEIILPESITKIGKQAFYGCSNLEELIIPEGVISIGEEAFIGCGMLRINLPASLEVLDDTALDGSNMLTEINVNEGGASFVSVNGVLFNASMTELVKYPASKEPELYAIPDGVEIIGYGAFRASGITGVTFPSSITILENMAFYGCEDITSINLPDLEILSEGVFQGCTGITEFIIPSTVSIIEDYAICGPSFKSITIPESVISIGEAAIFGRELKAIFVERESQEGIAQGANYMFSSLNKSLTIYVPDSSDAVAYREAEYWLAFASEIYPKSILDEEGFAVSDGYLVQYLGSETEVVIPSKVTEIGAYAFHMYPMTHLMIPDTVTTVWYYAFDACNELKDLIIPLGVTRIETNAVIDCEKLCTITIGAGVESIGVGAIRDCGSLKILNINRSVSLGIIYGNHEMLQGCHDYYIIVPDQASATAYKNASYWNRSSDNIFYQAQIQSDVFIINNGTLVRYLGNEQAIIVPANVTAIQRGAFGNCEGDISFEAGCAITSIAANAFDDYIGTSVILPETVASLGASAFEGCGNITDFIIPSNVTAIYDYCFKDCIKLEEMMIPNSVITCGYGVFLGCSGIKSATLGTGLTTVPIGIFNGCSNLEEINILGTITSIGYSAFASCGKLASFIIPSTVTSIGQRAFVSCTLLTSIVIPSSVTSIGEYAFTDSGIYLNAQENSLVYAGNWLVAIKGVVAEADIALGTVGVSANIFDAYTLQQTRLIIPASVCYIGAEAFLYLQLSEVIIEKPSSEGIIACGEDIFSYSGNYNIYLPDAASITAYSSAQYWSGYSSYYEVYED